MPRPGAAVPVSPSTGVWKLWVSWLKATYGNWFLLELKVPIVAGKTLIKVGETQRRLGAAEREFIHSASINFLTPLRNFLEGDWRTISVSVVAGKEKLVTSLETRRAGGERNSAKRTPFLSL